MRSNSGRPVLVCLICDWEWPRKSESGKDIQTCSKCGATRESLIHFDPPRYHQTQERAQPRRDPLETKTNISAEANAR